MKRYIKYVLLLFLAQSPLFLVGQYRESFYEEMKTSYPGHNYIQLKQENRYNIRNVEGQLQITAQTTEVYMVLKSTFGNAFSHSVYSSTFHELTDLEAFAYHKSGSKYKRNRIKEFHEKVNMDEDYFYDDQVETVINFPSVAAGSIMEIHATHQLNEPRFLGSEFLQYGNPVHELEITFECDPGIELDFMFMNTDQEEHLIERDRSGDRDIYRLRNEGISARNYEERAPSIRHFVPHMIPIIRSYEQDEQKVEVLEDVSSLYSYYYPFIKQFVDNEVPATIQSLSDSLTRDLGSNEEKARVIYQWVQQNINYIAFEYGMGGFIPRAPDLVLKNMYGDCKDYTSLLYAMFRAAGVPAHFTWIGTSHLPYRYDEVPTPLADNHMILSYPVGEEYVFLDGTASYQPMEFPSSFIQGKQALIAISEDSFLIRTVPVPEPVQNRTNDTVWISIEEDRIIGHGRMYLAGYPKIGFSEAYVYRTGDEKQKYVEGRVRKGNNKFILEDYMLLDRGRFEPDLGIRYNFTLGSYVNQIEDELYVNLNLSRPLRSLISKRKRTQPIDLEHRRQYSNHFCLQLPPGFEVKSLPGSSTYQSEDFVFRIEYELSDDQIWCNQYISVDQLIIGEELLTEWFAFLKHLEDAYRQSIILNKI